MPLDSEQVVVDHIIPRAKGGSNEVDNLQAVHPKCNAIKFTLDNDVARLKIMQMDLHVEAA